MRYINYILLVVAITMAVMPLSAQEHKHVEVTKNYTHEVSPAKKIVAPTTINEAPVIEPEIVYSINPESWQVKLEDHNFKPATASYWDNNRPHRFFASVATGYPLTSDAVIRYTTHNVRLGYFGVGIDHAANFAAKSNGYGDKLSIANSYSMSNAIHVGGGVVTGRKMFEARVDYGSDIVNRYGMKSPDRIYFHDGNLSLRYGDDFVDLSRLNFAIEANGGRWSQHLFISDEYPCIAEHNANIAANLARDFKGNIVGVKAGFGIWKDNGYAQYRDMAVNVGVNYARSFGIINLKAEVGYMYDKVSGRKASHFILPAVRMDFDFGKIGIQPYIELETNITHNGIEALYNQNRYIAFEPMAAEFNKMKSTRSYDLHLGIAGSDKHSKVAYRVYLGSSFIRDQMFWYVDEIGTFGFTQGSNTRLFAGAEVEYHPVGGLRLAASARAHLDNTLSPYAVSDPKIVANILAEYRLKRWKFGISGDFVGRRKWSGSDYVGSNFALVFFAPATFDLHADVAFRINGGVELFVSGYNLLNQDIFDYAYYYRNGIGFMLGAKIDF